MIFKNISTKHQVFVVKSYWFGQVKKVIDNGLSDSTSIFFFFFFWFFFSRPRDQLSELNLSGNQRVTTHGIKFQ